jgi:hypothetical protein
VAPETPVGPVVAVEVEVAALGAAMDLRKGRPAEADLAAASADEVEEVSVGAAAVDRVAGADG